MWEEVGAKIKNLTYIGMIENIFEYDGKPGHEIVLVYEADFADSLLYEIQSITCRDDDGLFIASWRPIIEFDLKKAPLYPEGLLDLLEK